MIGNPIEQSKTIEIVTQLISIDFGNRKPIESHKLASPIDEQSITLALDTTDDIFSFYIICRKILKASTLALLNLLTDGKIEKIDSHKANRIDRIN